MEWARYRDMTRIYILVIGAFTVTFFVRQGILPAVLGGVTAGRVALAVVLLVFMLFGLYMLYFGLEKWDRFYSDFTAPSPVYPQYGYYQPYYYPPPAYYYAPPAYSMPPYAPPAYGMYYPQYQQYHQPAYQYPPAQQYPAPPAQQAPAQYRPAQAQSPVSQYRAPPAHPPAAPYPSAPQYQPAAPYQSAAQYQPVPAHPPAQPFPVDAAPRYAPAAPAFPAEPDPRRALILPDATKLLAVFLGAVLIGGVALAAAYYITVLALFVFLPAFIIGFSFPSLIWISYVYHSDKTHRLPSKTVLKAFVWGMLSTVPALIVNTAAGEALGYSEHASLAVTLIVVAAVAPLIEEFSKPWGVRLVRDDVRGPLDGLILGVTCGVGFALIENITYEFMFAAGYGGAAAVWTLGSLARGLGSIMVHAAGAGLIGYAYGRHRTGGGLAPVALAYIAAVAMHAAWNGSSALFATADWGILGSAGFMVLFVAATYLLLRHLIDRGAALEAQAAGQVRVP
jgi:RsiW-degrading membrane proteinase PrsW (M82 family)